MAAAHEQHVPLRATESQVGADLRQTNPSKQLAVRGEDNHTRIAKHGVGTDPQIAEHISAHSIRSALHPVHRHVGESTHAAQFGPIDIERKHVAAAARAGIARTLARTDDIQRLVVRRETQAVGIGELVLGNHHIQPSGWVPAIHGIRQLPLPAADRSSIRRANARVQLAGGVGRTAWIVGMALGQGATVWRIGEPDTAVGMRDKIVWGVQALALKLVGDDRHGAVMFPPDDPAVEILGRKLPPLEVERIAVAVVGWVAKAADAASFPDIAVLDVGLDIAEHEILALVGPGRTLGPFKTGRDPSDGGNAEQILFKRGIGDDDVGIGIDLGRCISAPLFFDGLAVLLVRRTPRPITEAED